MGGDAEVAQQSEGKGLSFGKTSASLLHMTKADDADRLQILLVWAKAHNIWIHDGVSIGSMPRTRLGKGPNVDIDKSTGESDDGHDDGTARGTGYGIYVKAGHILLPRQVVVLVPKTIMFSGRTATLAPHLTTAQLFNAEAAAGLLLTTCLLHEFLLGPEGPWWGYLQSLPRLDEPALGDTRSSSLQVWGIPLPLNVDKESEAWSWLQKTECGRMVRRAEADQYERLEGIGMGLMRMRTYFVQSAMPLLQKVMPGRDLDSVQLWPDFVRMQSIISSRSFVVDMYHGLALVPVADMFNHEDDPNVHFEADDEVCDECGALGACPHNDDPLPASAYGRPSAFLPAESGPNSAQWNPPAALDGVDTVDLVAQEHILEYSEAYNNYGNLSNSILLATYGFCLPEETRWERYGWEWRNEVERNGLLSAFGIPQAGTKTGRKRPVEDDNINVAKSRDIRLEKWAEQCARWSSRPLAEFAEVYLDPIKVLREAHDSEGAPDISLPVNSPWSLLAPAEEPDEQDDDSTLIDAVARPTISNLFVPLSQHDGSRDRYQPLFIDLCGRISLPLWRAALLLAIAESNASVDGATQSVDSLARIEDCIEKAVSDAQQGVSSTTQAPQPVMTTHERALALAAMTKIKTLIDGRLDSLGLHEEEAQKAAARQLSQSPPGLLQSAITHALQENNALTSCAEHLIDIVKVLGQESE